MPVTVINRYDYDARALVAPGVNFDPKKNKADRSLTNQADMDAADINKIMARFEQTGVLLDPQGVERKPMYADFTEVKDYHSMLSALRRAETAFGLLPAATRNRFNNDPQQLIEFLDDPKNQKEAVKLGLLDKTVLLTEKDLDGITRITPEQKAAIDAFDPAKKAERLKMLQDARKAGLDPETGGPLAAPGVPPAQ